MHARWIIHRFLLILVSCIALTQPSLVSSTIHPSKPTEWDNHVSASVRTQELQPLSSAGQAELFDIIMVGELPELRWPRFGDLQIEIRELYSSTGYSLAWFRMSTPTPQARAMINLLKSAGRKGLEPEDYDGPRWDERITSLEDDRRSSELNLVHFDAELTVAAMRYISDLYRGRVSPRSVHFAIDINNGELDLSEFLRLRVINATNMEAVISEIEPQFPSYRRTLVALQTYLALASSDDGTPLPLPTKPVNPGQPYVGVPRLTRLGLTLSSRQ